jgi:hypothetical protein
MKIKTLFNFKSTIRVVITFFTTACNLPEQNPKTFDVIIDKEGFEKVP